MGMPKWKENKLAELLDITAENRHATTVFGVKVGAAMKEKEGN